MNKLKKAILVINHKEFDSKKLENIRVLAIDMWEKSETIINRAENRKREAENAIRFCNSRIRLLKIMSEYQK